MNNCSYVLRAYRPKSTVICVGLTWRRAAAVAMLAATAAWTLPSHGGVVSPRRLLEVVDLGNPAISPDGRSVAFRAEQASVEQNSYESTWYVQQVDGAQPPRRIASGGEPLREYVTGLVLPAPATWSPDGRWIYYRAQMEGKVAVWRANADGSGAFAVTSDPADVRGFALSADGKTLLYRVGGTREEVAAAELGEYDRGVHIDDTVFIGAGLFRSSKLEGRLATHRFLGDWFSTGPLLAHIEDRWKALDMASSRVREPTKTELQTLRRDDPELPREFADASQIIARPTDTRIALLLERGTQLRSGVPATQLAVLPSRRSARPVACVDPLCTTRPISSAQWRPQTDEIIFMISDYREGRAKSLYRWDVATGSVALVVKTTGLMSGGQRHWDVPCSASSDVLVCVFAAADEPPRLEAIDLTIGERQVLFAPNAGLAADIAAAAPATLMRWTDAGGREYTGQFFEARGGVLGPNPLFVTFYTCDGFLRGGIGDEWPLASMAEQGISALCINGTPSDYPDRIDRFAEGPASIASIVGRLSAAGKVDPQRVGMGGLSYGGEITMWTLTHSDLLAAASLASSATSPTYYLMNSLRSAFREGLMTYWKLGSPNETTERWRSISPTFQADQIHAPVLFQLPEQEYLYTLDYALPLVRENRADMYVFPHEPHIKFQPRHKLAAYERNLDWFRFWLQSHEDADPAKAEQYERWRLIRLSTASARASASDGIRSP